MAENDGKVVFELDVDDSQIQGKIDRALVEMRRAAQSGRNALLSLDADTAAALARLHRVQAESNAAGSVASSSTDAASGATTGSRHSATASGAPSPATGADVSRGGGVAGALSDAAASVEQVAVNAGGMAEASASAAEALAGQAESARGAEASMRSAWASMALIDGAAAGLRSSLLAASDAAGGISGAISALISRIRGTSASTGGSGAGTGRLSKYAVGLDVVPYNEYPALLHKGEMVLNAAEASAYRMGGGRGADGFAIDYDCLARAMANVSLEMDGQKVGRLVEKSVSAAQSVRYNRAARKG